MKKLKLKIGLFLVVFQLAFVKAIALPYEFSDYFIGDERLLELNRLKEGKVTFIDFLSKPLDEEGLSEFVLNVIDVRLCCELTNYDFRLTDIQSRNLAYLHVLVAYAPTSRVWIKKLLKDNLHLGDAILLEYAYVGFLDRDENYKEHLEVLVSKGIADAEYLLGLELRKQEEVDMSVSIFNSLLDKAHTKGHIAATYQKIHHEQSVSGLLSKESEVKLLELAKVGDINSKLLITTLFLQGKLSNLDFEFVKESIMTAPIDPLGVVPYHQALFLIGSQSDIELGFEKMEMSRKIGNLSAAEFLDGLM
ncbi:hypothetical protein [Ferrimonas sp. YFM]|uniref:hypothetical protein n=1 Tax=Ferrimonas sp. YFM TaxID=3028878 RepID=UPI002573BAD0|nr:hypothetical protein [Ferrimonas sp. YFM]